MAFFSEGNDVGLTVDLIFNDSISKIFVEFLLHVWVAVCTVF